MFLLIFFFGCQQETVVEVEKSEEAQEVENFDQEAPEPELRFSCRFSNLSDALRSPDSIAQAVDLINALPKPLDLSCFIAALKRPIQLVATDSKSSAQPALDAKTPRVFIFNENLYMSVTTGGDAIDTLEFGEIVGPARSLKGELTFPLLEDATVQDVFDHVKKPEFNNTTCFACHKAEEFDAVSGGYTSVMIRPSRTTSLFDLDNERYLCQVAEDNEGRCKMIRAIMAYGTVIEAEFDPSLPTLFEAVNL